MSDPTRLIVQKFGGTSVASAAGRQALVLRVRGALEAGERTVVVVSAMGRDPSPYATDTLLALTDTDEPRERDRLAACGEIISSVVVAGELRRAGVPARSFTGAEAGIVTDERHGDARILAVEPSLLREALDDGEVPVLAGFQGISRTGELTTLGRGGSDTTACAVAVALGADEVRIHSDVDGVMTADPRTCHHVEVIDEMRFEELFQMARHGSRIMHAPAAEVAMRAGIPVRILSTFSSAPGTLVSDGAPLGSPEDRKVATGVSHVDHVARVTVTLPDGDDGAHMGAQTLVYRTMADADVSLDMFTPCGPNLVLNIREGDVARAMRALDALELPYGIETGLAKVTLVGAGMHGVPGVMARLAEALRSAGVRILQAADSHATISVLVWQNDRSEAVSALHREFDLDVTHPLESDARPGEADANGRDPDPGPATRDGTDTSTRG